MDEADASWLGQDDLLSRNGVMGRVAHVVDGGYGSVTIEWENGRVERIALYHEADRWAQIERIA